MLWLPLPWLLLPFLAPGAEAGVRQGVVTFGTTVSSGFSRLFFLSKTMGESFFKTRSKLLSFSGQLQSVSQQIRN